MHFRGGDESNYMWCTVTVTGTAGVKESLLGLDSWIAAAEEVSLQTASKVGKRRYRRDVLRQCLILMREKRYLPIALLTFGIFTCSSRSES